MSKYDPLGTHLKAKGAEHVPMTFAEIEKIVGEPLPNSKAYPAWWSNNPSNNVMTKVWLAAGYRTEQVDIEGEKLVFSRASTTSESGATESATLHSENGGGPKRSGLIGWLKGKITIAEGTDLTKPADPSWGEQP